MTDRDLIDATLRGDREAFGHLVQRYQRLVEAAAYCATGRHELVDDIVQDTFITAWRTIERLRDADSLRSWLYGIARNLGLKARRKHGRPIRSDEVGPIPTPLDVVFEREREREVAAALRGLPERYRQPLVLFYYEQCSVKEVAAALAMHEDAAMQRLSRGRRKLGEALAARVESVLESKPTRVAVGAALLLLLPVRAASAATGAPSLAGSTTKGSLATSIAKWAACQWRVLGAVAGSAAAMGVFVIAIAHSNEVAAHAAKRAAVNAPPPSVEQPAPSAPAMPSLIDANIDDETVHRSISVADLDPVATCRRGAASLVVGALGKNAFRREGVNIFYEPSEELKQLTGEVADRAAATCGGDRWPEIYVVCEGTIADIRDGTITCYPYSPFL